ncbi:hypothetical protein HYPBUDRAFT_107563 [Hyphopichia burtonii NRRL Y-1933]|uniref:NADH dehydrogenase [ubiquinone] iron-sulfur protein 4, mitochondrial n=1 Tax=Hyphopichia burtonii NRRL Y-1933 TaxID=984485 RepID=A0A1E4RK22_9ASCO|nr:hypothetical protein HYPBUDRAFT_107563 [Hyphopichia burtonii NRRL Y-1933]ODV67628.1 hypothetical protein HYPBUDRAFT_107563 [Hyphopichia burtonii NRRL Y-1933]
MIARSTLRSLSSVRAPAGARAFATGSVLQQKPVPYDETKIRSNEVVSGAPQDLSTNRVVRIYLESKPATQSGHHNAKSWKLDWDVLGKGNRWENDLIGYQSSADYMQGTIMKFDTKEAAIRFAQGQGWDHYVQEPKKRHFRKKEYAANFYHSAGPLKHIRTK